MASEATPLAAPVAQLVSTSNPNVPPGRVRYMFKKLDANQDGSLTLDELLQGFEREFGELAPHAKEAIPALFEKHATPCETNGKALKINYFSRFYAEVLYKHFDTDNNGTLDLEEAQRALKFLVRPKDGANPELAIAFPSANGTDTNEVKLPFRWFWAQYCAMD